MFDRAHKEVLFFASPFFEAALSGNWAETGGGRPQSVSSVITISQPPHVASPDGHTDKSLAELSQEIEILEATQEDDSEGEAAQDDDESSAEEISKAREASFQQLQNPTPSGSLLSSKGKQRALEIDASNRPRSQIPRRPKHNPDGVIVLKEEKVRSL